MQVICRLTTSGPLLLGDFFHVRALIVSDNYIRTLSGEIVFTKSGGKQDQTVRMRMDKPAADATQRRSRHWTCLVVYMYRGLLLIKKWWKAEITRLIYLFSAYLLVPLEIKFSWFSDDLRYNDLILFDLFSAAVFRLHVVDGNISTWHKQRFLSVLFFCCSKSFPPALAVWSRETSIYTQKQRPIV